MEHTFNMILESKVATRAVSRCGFNVIGLAAVTAVVTLLVLALIPAVLNQVMGANMTAVGTRGRDIYVAITGANTEREPLGLPPVWPSEGIQLTNAVDDIASMVFTNSTDYFNVLIDGKNLGTERWSPFVAGCNFLTLAGAGVPACTTGKLTAENNLWTVAMNVRDEMDDMVPLLITRNVDASSLADKVAEKDWDKMLRFDPEWDTPYGNKAFILIRKGGSIFKCRAKYASYGVVYGKRSFDARVDIDGRPVKPLKYLTPTRMVVLGEQAYAEGAARAARPAGVAWRLVRRDLTALARVAWPVGACAGLVYLLALGVYAAARYRRRLKPVVTGYGLGLVMFHYAAVVLWLGVVVGSGDGVVYRFRWTLIALALLAQAGGIAYVAARRRYDRAARQRGMKWMVAAPLIIFIVPAGGLLVILLAEICNFELVVALLVMAIAVLTFVVVRRKK